MAYKFQVGAATLSGSVTLKESATFSSGFSNADQNITNVGDIAVDSISGDANDITISLTDNRADGLQIAESSNIYMNFDTRNGQEIINVGKKMQIMDDTKLTFGNGDDAAFEYDEDGNDVLLYTGASIRISDDTKLEFGAGGDASFEYDEDGNDVLLYAGAHLRIGDDIKIEFGAAGDAGIEYDEDGTDQLRIHAPAAGVVIAGTSPSLTIGDAGAEDTKIVFDGNAQDFYIGLDDTDDDLKIGLGSAVGSNTAITLNGDANATFAGNVTVAGNFTVQGTTTSVDSTTINISSSFTFEGPADDHETTLTCGTPTADTTITLPQIAAGTYHVAVLADATTAAAAAVTAAEFALLDGGSTVGTTALASGDGFLHNDNGTMKQTSVDKIADLFAGDGTGGLAASSGELSIDIDGLGALGGTGLHQTQDHFIFSDNGTEKKITFSNLEDAIFGNVSGDATIAAGGALTIAAGAVEGSMVADDLISAQSNLGGTGVAQADEFLFSDDGTLKAITFSNLEDAIFGNVSGDIAIAAGGAATIQANAVEGSMLNNNIVSGLDDIGAAIADTDEMIISDAGTIKRMDMSRIKTYIGPGSVTVTSFGDADATLAVGVNVASANTSTARTLTLPASAGLSAGDSVKVKVAGVSSGAVTIARAGSQTIDGSLTSVVLESDNAAIELIYAGADDWRIF